MAPPVDETGVVITLVSGIYGVLVGSFLNVVIARVPAGHSVMRPRSACPHCAEPVAPRDNLPLLSWMILRGRCRHCRNEIGWRYPLVEAATGIAFALTAAVMGPSLELAAHLVLVAGLVAVTVIDIETYRIPTVLLRGVLAVGAPLLVLAAVIEDSPRSLVGALVGAAVGGAALLAVHVAAPASMGFGDVRLASVLGLFCGYRSLGHVPLALLVAFCAGAGVGVGLMLAGRAGRRSRIPFGPFLAMGAWVSLLWGEPILDWYGSL